jgi:hypothetical protein
MAYLACIIVGMIAGAVLMLWLLLPPDLLSIFTTPPEGK